MVLRGDPCDTEDRNRYVFAQDCAREKYSNRTSSNSSTERTKVIKAIGSTLQKTALKIITIVNRDKDHIPPITTSETNPFPYHIDLNPRGEGWGRNIGIF